MASLTVTYLFCSPLQSDVCHRTKDLINASPCEPRNWLRLRWQTITESFLSAIGWQGVGELMSQKFVHFKQGRRTLKGNCTKVS